MARPLKKATPLTAGVGTAPPSVAFPPVASVGVRLLLKLVATLPYLSSASISKPNWAPATLVPGGLVTTTSCEAGPAVTLMLLVVIELTPLVETWSVTVPTFVRLRPVKSAMPAAAWTVIGPDSVLFPEDVAMETVTLPLKSGSATPAESSTVTSNPNPGVWLTWTELGGWVVSSSLAGGIGVTLIGLETLDVRPSPVAIRV